MPNKVLVRPSRIIKPAGASSPPTDNGAPLFRHEVIAERQTPWLGTVLMEPRVSSRYFVVFAMSAALAVILLLLFGSFARKARVAGWLVPEKGLARVFAPQAAVVSRIHIVEGESVAPGTPLISLSTDVQSEKVGATREEVVRRLIERRGNLTADKKVKAQQFAQQSNDLRTRLTQVAAEQRHLTREIELQRNRIKVAATALRRGQDLKKRGLVTMTRLEAAEQTHLEQMARLETLERNLSTLSQRHVEVRGTLQDLPLRHKSEIALIDRSVATLEQELAEAEARRQIVIAAPIGGTVTAIQAETGGDAKPTAPLLSIVPHDSPLQAHLFCPSRAIGFVREGQRVLLRYQSFPYQKFGFHEGQVTAVSRATLNPADLGPQLAGLSGVGSSNEPIYRITVRLERQSVMAYGEPVLLQPGMLVEADIVIETRRLIEWVLDPLYSLTGKLHG